MCEFISAYKNGNDYFYLRSQDLTEKKLNAFKKFNVNWREDLCGHGAILIVTRMKMLLVQYVMLK